MKQEVSRQAADTAKGGGLAGAALTDANISAASRGTG
jgi:hypothetical protein